MDEIWQMNQIAAWLRSMGKWAVNASLLLNVVISIFGVIPSVFLSGANAVVFGLVPGFAISFTGEAIGAVISFWVYRYGIRKFSSKKNESWGWVRRLNHANRKRKIFMLILARLTPFIPSGIVTFTAASTWINFLDFMLGPLIGKAPSVAMETLVGHDLFYIRDNLPRLLISLILISVIYWLFRKCGDSSKG